MRMIHSVCLVLMLCCAGCDSGGGSSATDDSTLVGQSPPAKDMLLEIAQSGEVGSGSMGLRESLEGMKATDSAKAEELLGDLDKLEGASSPDEVKRLAKEMADKL